MKQGVFAYLIQSDGQVFDMPTDEMLFSLNQVRQASSIEEHGVSTDSAAIYGFLQAIKKAMQVSQTTTQCNQFS